jgi:hypothetical protein
MKIRIGFVSNSSSCSFTCPACHNSWEGWDWDNDPMCDECGCYIFRTNETFADYLIKKYDLNIEEEIKMYKLKQEREYTERKRQEYIAEHGRDPTYD